MSIEFKLRRGTTAQHSTFTGAEGEVTVDTTKDVLVVHDGVTPGGKPQLSSVDGAVGTSNLADQAVTSAKMASGAARANLGWTTWNVTEVSGVLYFSVGGVNKAKLDGSGNLTVAGDITAFGSV